MGTFKCAIRISSMDGRQSREVEATVDTGAVYTTVPAHLLHDIGVEPKGTRRILLIDGRRRFVDFGEAWVSIDGESEVTVVVFGEDDGPALLGTYTLEGLALAVDPVQQELVPTHLIMY